MLDADKMQRGGLVGRCLSRSWLPEMHVKEGTPRTEGTTGRIKRAGAPNIHHILVSLSHPFMQAFKDTHQPQQTKQKQQTASLFLAEHADNTNTKWKIVIVENRRHWAGCARAVTYYLGAGVCGANVGGAFHFSSLSRTCFIRQVTQVELGRRSTGVRRDAPSSCFFRSSILE